MMLSLVIGSLCVPLLAAAASGGEQRAVQLARQLASQRLGVPPDRFTVRSVEPAEWPDSSLGCPRPGLNYRPAVTRGYRVMLEADGRVSTVHVAGEAAVLCEPHRSLRGLRFAPAPELLQLARRDLAARLNVPEDSVRVASTRPQTWPDASLGCPQPDKMYAQVTTPGFVIELESGGKTYRYHSDQQRVVHCND